MVEIYVEPVNIERGLQREAQDFNHMSREERMMPTADIINLKLIQIYRLRSIVS
jgi:hypothetical protein